MSKMLCVCGKVMSYNYEPIYTIGRLYLIPKEIYEAACSGIGESVEKFLDRTDDVWECPYCGRLYIPNGSDKLDEAGYDIFGPEEGKFVGAMVYVSVYIDEHCQDVRRGPRIARKMLCGCGEKVNFDYLYLISQGASEDLYLGMGRDVSVKRFLERARAVWECKECGRLYIQKEPDKPDSGYHVFMLEGRR